MATVRAKVNEEQIQLHMGKSMEAAARATLDVLDSEKVKKSDERRSRARAKLAEGMAMQGRFEEAAQEHPDKLVRKRYRDIQKAVWREDSESCNCPAVASDPRGPGGAPVDLPTAYVEEMVYSQKHGKMMPLIRCSRCNKGLNVTQMPPELAATHAVRGRSRVAAESLTPGQVRAKQG